ncbi:hypothetical protein T484DRAFT_1878454, partial [Baffinella frigidus]
MQKPWGGVFVALGSMAAMSPAAHAPLDANASWSSAAGSMPRYKTIAFSVVLVAVSIQFFHIPLIMRMGELQLKIPLPPPFPKGSGKAKVTQDEIIGWENVVETWHKTMWGFRAEIIDKLPFSSMDDEEEVEFERIKPTDSGKDKSTWLTAHLLLHLALVIVSHVHRSMLMPVLALVSDCMLLAVLIRAKNLSDAVTSSVNVLRKYSITLGTQVSLASSEGTLLPLEFLHNKLRILVDLHESHQLGFGFSVPLIGTVDLDLETLVSLSTGLAFELMILIASRVMSHTTIEHKLREQERQERQEQVEQLDQGNTDIAEGMQEVRAEIRSLREQVGAQSEELKRCIRVTALEATASTPPRRSSSGSIGTFGASEYEPHGWVGHEPLVSRRAAWSPAGAAAGGGRRVSRDGSVMSVMSVEGAATLQRTLDNFNRANESADEQLLGAALGRQDSGGAPAGVG